MRRGRNRWPADVLAKARAEKERLAALEGDRPPRPEAAQRAGPKLSKLEQRYRAFLEEEQRAGRILLYRWEPFRLVLRHGGGGQKGMTYAPDALVVWSRVIQGGGPVTFPGDPRVELHEVKPVKDDGSPLWLGDSRTKLLAAVELLRGVPWTFVLVTPEGSGWRRQCL